MDYIGLVQNGAPGKKTKLGKETQHKPYLNTNKLNGETGVDVCHPSPLKKKKKKRSC